MNLKKYKEFVLLLYLIKKKVFILLLYESHVQ